MTTTKPVAHREWAMLVLTALSAFCIYSCMYAFRKPFTVAGYTTAHSFLGVDYKIWLVMAQSIGYTLSKFLGIGFIGGLHAGGRAGAIIKLVTIAWVALFFFAIVPSPWNIVFLLINGLPLGVIYGLVFSYLEGRRATELLGAVLSASFIFASGFTQSAGSYILHQWEVSEWWMPFITGALFFPLLIFCTWLLNKTPQPSDADLAARTKRQPMTKKERITFFKTFMPGLLLLIITYIMLTILRDYRSNFASNIWSELGNSGNAAIFTQSEIPASLMVLLLMGLLVFVRNNIKALMVNHIIIFIGLAVSVTATYLFGKNLLSPFWWMTLTGVGLYMGYVPFNCMLFERLIASFKYMGNAGFIIYVADSFGYLGSNIILVVKNFMNVHLNWSTFFAKMIYLSSFIGFVLIFISAFYFFRKYRHSEKLSYNNG